MKRIALLILLYFSFQFIHAQNCVVSQLTTQKSVDDFAVNYPGCNNVNNDLVISGADIANLDGLSAITNIVGALNVNNNPALTSMTGLSQLVEVGSVNIESNASLTNLDGLSGLTSTKSSLRVVFGNNVTSIAALSNITSVGGFLSIGGNPVLTSLVGLEKLISIGGEVSLALNASLANFDGLVGLNSIGGYLYIADNAGLTSIAGLSQLGTMYGYLRVSNNDALTSLSGLDNINPNGFFYVLIENSNLLSFCGVKSICLYTAIGGGTFTGNATGCMSADEVKTSGACQTVFPVDFVSFSGKNTPEGNLLEWSTATETNNFGFEVQRSTNSRTFEKIGFVDGSNNSNVVKYYSYLDQKPAASSYYRLKQEDFDSTSTFSKIIVVKANDVAVTTLVYPNPSSGDLQIKTKNPDQSYKIQTAAGITVQEGTKIPEQPLDTRKLQNGTYLITVGEEVFKVIVAN